MKTTSFQTSPDRYVHWRMSFDGPVATLTMDVQEDKPWRGDYVLKLNSYDLGVDIELADAIQRLRFEHPEVKVLQIRSGNDRVFSSGANIFMLQSSTHAFKVNFCKYTNETRLGLEELARESGVRTIAALNGTASGGGYELAISCDEIHLIEDGNSAVSLPEVPLLGVLPGTGGLTRLVDKRKIRRDLADVFSTTAEGVRGPRAVKWNLVDFSHPKSKFEERLQTRIAEVAKSDPPDTPFPRQNDKPGIVLHPIEAKNSGNRREYEFVTLEIDDARRIATLTMMAPSKRQPTTANELRAAGDSAWVVKAWREFDDALLQLRFENPEVGVIVLKTRGDPQAVLDGEHCFVGNDWLNKEVRLLISRVLRRLDNTSKSLFAIIDSGSCFVSSLFELALAADRSFMLNDPERPVQIMLTAAQARAFEMSHGLSRLECRFFSDPERASKLVMEHQLQPLDAETAAELGLVTFTPDEIDWEDEVRIAIEERASLSPDALTGMEQNLRFAGAETMETKVFGRLSAWQNWIFTRPNATGDLGALSVYGRPERASFDWKRT